MIVVLKSQISLSSISSFLILALTATISATASDDPFVFIEGQVEFNQISNGPLGDVNPGDVVVLNFTVDPDDFVESKNFPTRGYVIDQSTFELTISNSLIQLQNPFPKGRIPYLVIRNDDPQVDGFFVSTNFEAPNGVPLDLPGQFGQFRNNFSVTFGGDSLPSLEIFDAEGGYDFSGLSAFNWTITDGGFDAMGIIFTFMQIASPDVCPLGDLNNDCVVNLLDVAPFVETIINSDFRCQADINGDGVVDLLDVSGFTELIASG